MRRRRLPWKHTRTSPAHQWFPSILVGKTFRRLATPVFGLFPGCYFSKVLWDVLHWVSLNLLCIEEMVFSFKELLQNLQKLTSGNIHQKLYNLSVIIPKCLPIDKYSVFVLLSDLLRFNEEPCKIRHQWQHLTHNVLTTCIVTRML